MMVARDKMHKVWSRASMYNLDMTPNVFMMAYSCRSLMSNNTCKCQIGYARLKSTDHASFSIFLQSYEWVNAQGWYFLLNNPWGSAQKQVLGGVFVHLPSTCWIRGYFAQLSKLKASVFTFYTVVNNFICTLNAFIVRSALKIYKLLIKWYDYSEPDNWKLVEWCALPSV